MQRIFRHLAVAICAVFFGAASASAESVYVEYYATLADVDLVNSSGVPLGDSCSILQQDRANVHRFGRAHSGDRPDPVFGNKTMRARLGDLCQVSGGFPFVQETINRWGSMYVWVIVYQDAGQLTRMVVRNGAG
ncbi:hypothetical protein [uncultured Tateyamaria sp.]|uniref:hypothetical protein n=1 Tax=uncultured Tateyamaria sp. TaxID=455651 RepID=UPI002614444D|nr:hypothetical protein [uncultured Tateyamaria sp.]